MPASSISHDDVICTNYVRRDSALVEASDFPKASILPTRSASQQHSVRFRTNAAVREIENIGDSNENQVSDLWYSHKEFESIKSSSRHSLELLTSGRALEGDDHTMRGLECRTPAGYERRKRNKFDAVCAVLDEQDRQYMLGIQDPEAIAEAYILESEHCVEDALDQGMADEEDASGLMY
eukprot:CAMPEP_0116822908 /NCGR_PEP_ID=MMETSP0418-20121206/538_1 /TAXON_ID=1158023 /ORGANISM="Astrosyne radiata, Strain 13vi08-1A" /LENGTH=179 /DNA_ID=CAMNT_0004451091 /DNA_START=93 /DNA_END=632 /DNA_ORIENTATION=+